MQRRTFLLGFFSLLAGGSAGLLAPSAKAEALSPAPLPDDPGSLPSPDLTEADLDGLEIAEARRRRKRRRWWRRYGRHRRWGRRYRSRRWGRRSYRLRSSSRRVRSAPRAPGGWRTPGQMR